MQLFGPILSLLAALTLFVAAGRLPVVPVPGQLGPDFWPRVVLVGLMGSSLLKIWEVVRAGGQNAEERPVAAPATAPAVSLAKLGGGITFIVGYAALTPLIGFPLANLLFLAAFMWLAGLRRPIPLFLTATLGTVFLLYLFVKVVYLPLPKGAGVMEDFTISIYRLLGIF